MKIIKTTMDSENPVLICPTCRGQNVNFLSITVFSRPEDAIATTRTHVSHKKIIVEQVLSDGSGNPSSRRDGLKLTFECEGCDFSGDIVIAQHKGRSEFAWSD